MRELPKDANVNCECFLNELEGLPSSGAKSATAEVLLSELTETAREHAPRCAQCGAALRDFAETRRALERMAERMPEAGPWFTGRVMHAIAEKEEEIEERQTGFWNGVRRMAPRLVAFATLVLMLGGTWAFQERRASQARGPEMGATEGIFETMPSGPVNDDVVASVHEEKLP